MHAASVVGVDIHYLPTSINAHTRRNNLVHPIANQYKQHGRFHDIAKALHEEECDLPLIIPYELTYKKAVLLQIFATIKECFCEINKNIAEDPHLWDYSSKALFAMSDKALGQERSDEPATVPLKRHRGQLKSRNLQNNSGQLLK